MGTGDVLGLYNRHPRDEDYDILTDKSGLAYDLVDPLLYLNQHQNDLTDRFKQAGNA